MNVFQSLDSLYSYKLQVSLQPFIHGVQTHNHLLDSSTPDILWVPPINLCKEKPNTQKPVLLLGGTTICTQLPYEEPEEGESILLSSFSSPIFKTLKIYASSVLLHFLKTNKQTKNHLFSLYLSHLASPIIPLSYAKWASTSAWQHLNPPTLVPE